MIRMRNLYGHNKILAGLLAIMILLSSIGITLDFHYCSGQLKTFSLNGTAQTCHEKSLKKNGHGCPHHQKKAKEASLNEDESRNCCSNKTLKIEQDDAKDIHSTSSFAIKDQLVKAWSISVFIVEKSTNLSIEKPKNFLYKPPPLSRDIYALCETFLL
jgi:hypothetical protein